MFQLSIPQDLTPQILLLPVSYHHLADQSMTWQFSHKPWIQLHFQLAELSFDNRIQILRGCTLPKMTCGYAAHIGARFLGSQDWTHELGLVWWESNNLPGPSCDAFSLQTMNGCGGPSGGRLTLGIPSEQSTDSFFPGVFCCNSSMAAASADWVLSTETDY